MTLPQNVKDAVQDMGSVGPHEEVFGDRVQGWLAVISTHLLSQEAEIADLIGKRDFLLRHYNLAESRLAAANALLRECVDNREGLAYEAALLARIQSHLQGAGDEA